MPVTAGALLTSVCVNGSIGLGCLCLFGGLRKWKVTEKLYEPKRCECLVEHSVHAHEQTLVGCVVLWPSPHHCMHTRCTSHVCACVQVHGGRHRCIAETCQAGDPAAARVAVVDTRSVELPRV